jgi:hypothetical protein
VSYRAFTVDRDGSLVPGLEIGYVPTTTVAPPDLQGFIAEWFPNGVSPHGEMYLLRSNPGVLNPIDPGVELICELVRRAEFPDAPSRYTSMFGSETIAGAADFRAQYRIPTARIFEVECARRPFRADMRALDVRSTAAVTTFGARKYWAQEPRAMAPWGVTVEPFWELLLSLPLRVVREVS